VLRQGTGSNRGLDPVAGGLGGAFGGALGGALGGGGGLGGLWGFSPVVPQANSERMAMQSHRAGLDAFII
jgi:hypothetical protein